MNEQTYLEDEDPLSDTAKLAMAIMAAWQDIRSGLYAVANAMILDGHKFGEPVKNGPFANPARVQEIIETARWNNLQTT